MDDTTLDEDGFGTPLCEVCLRPMVAAGRRRPYWLCEGCGHASIA